MVRLGLLVLLRVLVGTESREAAPDWRADRLGGGGRLDDDDGDDDDAASEYEPCESEGDALLVEGCLETFVLVVGRDVAREGREERVRGGELTGSSSGSLLILIDGEDLLVLLDGATTKSRLLRDELSAERREGILTKGIRNEDRLRSGRHGSRDLCEDYWIKARWPLIGSGR